MTLPLPFLIRLYSTIFSGSNKARGTPKLVSFRGLIQNFRWASLVDLYGSPPPGVKLRSQIKL